MAMELGKTGGKPGRARPSMNVTPLVDVVLVLLIIFMVVTPLMAKQFWIHLPNKEEKEETPPSTDDESVVVLVTKQGEIMINSEKVPNDQFSAKLHRVLAAKRQRTVFFDADEDADFGVAVSAMDLARGGGAATIAVVTKPMQR